MSGPASTTADITFFNPPPSGERAYQKINADLNTGVRERNTTSEVKQITIENVRGDEDSYTLDTAGFQIINQPAKHTAFVNDAEIEREYYPESAELIKQEQAKSYSSIIVSTEERCAIHPLNNMPVSSTAIRRRRPGVVDSDPTKRQPVSGAHVDQTTKSSISRVHRHLPADEAPELLKHRFQIINLWRPISHPAIDWPLALCDYRSVNPATDTFPVALVYPDREGETLSVSHNPNQKWKYFHAVSPQEAILIKCFDSVQDGSVAVFTPHTGFQDSKTPQGTPPRESIELRALVFYD